MPSLGEIAAFLEELLGAPDADEPPTVYRAASDDAVRGLGLALEPWDGMAGWIAENGLDAVFLHRPWKVDTVELPPHVGVLCAHRGFDARGTVGFNLGLGAALGFRSTDREPLGEKDGRPLGMIGTLPNSIAFDDWARRVEKLFGGVEKISAGRTEVVTRVAAVGAMTDALVREAAARGVDAYLTGQQRLPAADALRDTGLALAAVGHARAEEHGLRQLSASLRERWDNLRTVTSCTP